jgi:hypothetical protein
LAHIWAGTRKAVNLWELGGFAKLVGKEALQYIVLRSDLSVRNCIRSLFDFKLNLAANENENLAPDCDAVWLCPWRMKTPIDGKNIV